MRVGGRIMSTVKFSVVVPCFNAAATVTETIASVLAQTCSDFEIVAVDNNSTDATARILAALAAEHPRLRIVQQPVQGLSAARNAGIRAALGSFIALLDADDVWDRDYLEAHAANFDSSKADVSYSRIRLIDLAGRPTGQITQPQLTGLTAADLLRSNPCTSMIVVRRAVFDQAGLFNEQLRRVEDQEWLFRVLAKGFVLCGIGQVVASYRITPGGLSANIDAMLAAHDQMLALAAEFAPALVARERRLAHASMLRYCARRAIDHAKGAQTARTYLARMLRVAPDLIVREPLATLKTVASVMLPSLAAWRGQRGAALQTGQV